MPWLQATTWPELLAIARLADRLGYDHLWVPDHLLPVFGDLRQPILEAWTVLAACAGSTDRVRLGVLVSANTFRNPALLAKMATTVDHASGGRTILGVGAGWFEQEHAAHGIDFGSGPGERLDRLDEALGVVRRLLDGETVTHEGRSYRFRELRHAPRPVQERLPVLVGGSGERKTTGIVARHADMWNAMGRVDDLRRKDAILRRRCEELGRDPATIERSVACKPIIRGSEREALAAWDALMERNRAPGFRDPHLWAGSAEQIAERIVAYREIGFGTVIAELPAPYDVETLERLVEEVRPMLGG